MNANIGFLLNHAMRIAAINYSMIYSIYNNTWYKEIHEEPCIKSKTTNFYYVETAKEVMEMIFKQNPWIIRLNTEQYNTSNAVFTFLNNSLSFPNQKFYRKSDNTIVLLSCLSRTGFCQLNNYRVRKNKKKSLHIAYSKTIFRFKSKRDFRYFGSIKMNNNKDAEEMQLLLKPPSLKRTSILKALIFGFSSTLQKSRKLPQSYVQLYNRIANQDNLPLIPDTPYVFNKKYDAKLCI